MQPPADRDGRRSAHDEDFEVRGDGDVHRALDEVDEGAASAARARATGLGALVLCGGASTRFGSDKALAEVAGTTLLERTLDLLAQRTDDLVVATGHAPRYADVLERFRGLRVALDREPGLGPLAGLEAGLARFDPRSSVLVVACDLPNLDLRTLDALVAERHRADLDLCLWRDGDGLHPLLGCYRASVLPAVRAALDRGERRLVAFHGGADVPPAGRTDARSLAVDVPARDRLSQGGPESSADVARSNGTVPALRVGYLSADGTRDRSDPAANANSRSELRRILGGLPASEESPSAPRRPSTP
ncbi:molybdenum cofactor guanylyltransferase [Rohdeia mirabilis]